MNKQTPLPNGWQELVQSAREVRNHAYAPYSKFFVGAALRMTNGRIYRGCNVENSSFGLTICAERVAMSSAVAVGNTQPDVLCISLAGQPVPCGSCRQFLHEFNPELALLLDDCDTDAPPECVSLMELLPRAFCLTGQD